jgi:nicotinate-nucleotide pyrophosphorylase (carboxylating)
MNITLYERLISEITTEKLLIANEIKTLYIVSLEDGVVSGLEESAQLLSYYNTDLVARLHKQDGDLMRRGDVLLSVIGYTHETIKLGRLITRLISRMSGIATLTKQYVDKLAPTILLDPHYYTPGLKALEKQALIDGGASDLNFRLVSKEEINILGGFIKAYEKVNDTEDVLCYEIIDHLDFDEIKLRGLDVSYIMLTNFNKDALRFIIERREKLTLIPQGLYPLTSLDEIKLLGYRYLQTPLVIKAARSLELMMTFSI